MFLCDLEILGPCNYRCPYCSPEGPRWATVRLHDLDKLEGLYRTFQEARGYVLTRIRARATEPTIHPQIREIINLATRAGGVFLVTNNSIPIRQWEPAQPARVYVVATYHPSQSELAPFMERLLALRDAGTVARPAVMAHPEFMPLTGLPHWSMELGRLQSRFQVYDFDLVCLPYRGRRHDRAFPKDYTTGERATFGFPLSDPPRALPALDGCIAGWRAVAVRHNTKMSRCPRLWPWPELPALLPGPAPCGVGACAQDMQSHDTRIFLPEVERAWIALEGTIEND